MTTTHSPSDARMTAQAPYESLSRMADKLGMAVASADPLTAASVNRIAAELRALAALPERAPVSAGGDAVAWLVRWQHGPNKKGTLAFNHEGEAREYAEWRGLGKEQWETPHWPVELIPLYATPAPPVGAWDRRGGTIYLDREEAGIVVDALIDHRENAEQRKGKNFASSSDYRANKCAELIGRLNTESAAPTPAEARGVGDGWPVEGALLTKEIVEAAQEAWEEGVTHGLQMQLPAWSSLFPMRQALKAADGVRFGRAFTDADAEDERHQCGCGESTCVEPWEPGCGLGTSAEHAVMARIPREQMQALDRAAAGCMRETDMPLLSELFDNVRVLEAALAANKPDTRQAQAQGSDSTPTDTTKD